MRRSLVTVATVGIVGLGTMGAGIAQVCLEAGHRVVARDVDAAALERGRGRIEAGLARRVAKGLLDEAAGAAARERLATVTGLEELAAAELVIEAIVEEPGPKAELFAALDGICPAQTILATNTSALSVTALAAASGRPSRVVGLHFFNPAPLMPLVEVVRTAVVDEEAFAAALAFASGLGKEAVPCLDTPGFLVNRLLIPMLNDAVRMLDETGAAPEDVDRALRAGAGWPMGPLALVDLIGVDVHAHAAEALWQARREERLAPPARLVRMVEAGHLGKKSGRGFYEYS
jgi:3-hydroxybutyryl-CoA dehydrogenase